MTLPSSNWIKKVEEAAKSTQEIPLWGAPPPFPWEQWDIEIARALGLPSPIKTKAARVDWRPARELLAGLGEDPFCVALSLTPLPHPAYFAMSQEDLARLTNFALHPSHTQKGFSDTKMREGFYLYLLLQAMDQAAHLSAFGDLSIALQDVAEPPLHSSFCIDVSISFNHHTVWGRIICPEPFHNEFRKHFLQKPPPPLLKEITHQLEVSLRLEVGHTTLPSRQWKNVAVGDFLILDHCTYDLKQGKGSAGMILGHSPLFRVRLRHHSIKIVDYAFYHEETAVMNTDTPKEPHEAREEEFSEEPMEEGDEALWSPPEPQHPPGEMEGGNQEIPITLTVEVARLAMSLDKVLELQPGNLIELPVRPEQGVWLTVQGKRIAKGELLAIGDILGVKILQIGS